MLYNNVKKVISSKVLPFFSETELFLVSFLFVKRL